MCNSISKLKAHIDKQIAFNQGMNLFELQADSTLKFIDGTKEMVQLLPKLSFDTLNEITDYAVQRTLNELLRINQYYAFDESAREELRTIYAQLLTSLKVNKEPERIAQNHYKLLREWLRTTNPFSHELYGNEKGKIDAVTCAEYSPPLQLSLLEIDPTTLLEPVLDIGCGRNGALVHYLNEQGIRTYGIDRLEVEQKHCRQLDWFEYDFGHEEWGSIISNLSFSNHFRHHHLRTDGHYVSYAKKYMHILQALKPGGTFYYSPGLPFIEQYLDSTKFKVTVRPIAIAECTASLVTRIALS